MTRITFFIYAILISWVFSCKKLLPEPEVPGPVLPQPKGEFIDDWTFKVYPNGRNFDIAEFRLWVPENIDDLKAILILSNHHNSIGLGLASSEEWQNFARHEQSAILAVHLESFPGGNEGYYSYASEGSGAALLLALDSLAEKHQIEQLKVLPFLMRGYSAGGVFSHNFSEFKPEKVIAFANIRGGSLDLTSEVNNPIPGLMLAGENDAPARNERIAEIVLSKRSDGAIWAYAIEPVSDHFGSVTASDKLIRSLFSKALEKRKNPGSNQLKMIPEEFGWLGNNESKEIFPFNDYPYEKSAASWLIDEEFANLWQAYQLD